MLSILNDIYIFIIIIYTVIKVTMTFKFKVTAYLTQKAFFKFLNFQQISTTGYNFKFDTCTFINMKKHCIPEQWFTEGSSEFPHHVRDASKLCLRLVDVLYHDSDLTVSVAKETPIVDVGRPYDSCVVIGNQQLTVNIDQFRHLETIRGSVLITYLSTHWSIFF